MIIMTNNNNNNSLLDQSYLKALLYKKVTCFNIKEFPCLNTLILSYIMTIFIAVAALVIAQANNNNNNNNGWSPWNNFKEPEKETRETGD